jgi:hypothetical protein
MMTTPTTWTRLNLRITEVYSRAQSWLRGRLEPVDERGGGRNSDEGFHIGGGAVIGGLIAAGVGAFVARQLGLLGD